jgi:hypothetical protein
MFLISKNICGLFFRDEGDNTEQETETMTRNDMLILGLMFIVSCIIFTLIWTVSNITYYVHVLKKQVCSLYRPAGLGTYEKS